MADAAVVALCQAGKEALQRMGIGTKFLTECALTLTRLVCGMNEAEHPRTQCNTESSVLHHPSAVTASELTN